MIMEYNLPTVIIIILNWNGGDDTIECLESLYQINYPNYRVFIVDNASEDNSIKKIKFFLEGKIYVKSKFFDYWSNNKPIKCIELFERELQLDNKKKDKTKDLKNYETIIIKNDRNYGFAGGNNEIIKFVMQRFEFEFILLLNNDTVVDKNFLLELVKEGIKNEKIGFIGPKTYFYENKGRKDIISFAGGFVNLYTGRLKLMGQYEIDKGQHDQIMKVDYVEGSCILLRKEIFEKIGYLDTNYHAYWEETDLCKRGLKSGFESLYVPNSKIWHKVSASFDSSTKQYYLFRNKIKFMKKNCSNLEYLSFLVYFMVYSFWATNIYFFLNDLKEGNGFDRNKYLLKGVFNGFIKR